jgi:hypothetical protein
MPRRSKIELSAETIQELEDKFYDFLNSLSHTETRNFFLEFLTDEEKMMMYKRLALYWSLLEGYPLAKIQQTIGVTHDTTRIYNKKKNTLSNEFRLLLKRITADEQVLSIPSQPRMQEEQREAEPTFDAVSEPEPTESQYTEPEHVEQPQYQQQPTQMESEQNTPEPISQMPVIEETIIQTEEEIIPSMEKESNNTSNENTEENVIPHIPMEVENIEQQAVQQPNEKEQNTEHPQAQNEEQPTEPEKKKSGIAKFFGF